MTWEPTDSASSSSSLPKPRFGPSCCYSTYSPSSSVLPSCLTIANRPPFAPRFLLAEPFWAAPDGGWLFICHKAGVVCKPETLCSTTSSLGNSQFRRSWIPLSPPDLNHQLKSLPIESNFGIQAKVTLRAMTFWHSTGFSSHIGERFTVKPSKRTFLHRIG